MNWGVGNDQLNAEQRMAVRLSPDANRLIAGHMFTGKTQTLLHRAKYLINEFHIRPDRLRILTSSWPATIQLRSLASRFGLSDTFISRYDEWCEQVYRLIEGQALPRNPWTGRIESNLVRLTARYAAIWTLALLPSYDVVLLDDAQTYHPRDLQLILEMGKHVTLFGRLFNDPADRTSNLTEAFGGQPDVELKTVYHGNAALGDLLEALQLQKSFLRGGNDEETPGVFCAQDQNEEFARLAEVIRERGARPETVGVFVPDLFVGRLLQVEMRKLGLAVEIHDPDNATFPDFANNEAKIVCLEDVGGISFDTVCLPLMNVDYYRGYDRDDLRDSVRRAAQSTRHWLYVSSTSEPILKELSCFRRNAAGMTNYAPEISPVAAAASLETPMDAIL